MLPVNFAARMVHTSFGPWVIASVVVASAVMVGASGAASGAGWSVYNKAAVVALGPPAEPPCVALASSTTTPSHHPPTHLGTSIGFMVLSVGAAIGSMSHNVSATVESACLGAYVSLCG